MLADSKKYQLKLTLLLLTAPFGVQALTPSQVFERVKDSVVVIKSLNAKGEPLGQGSGVLLPNGKVATNCHVVKEGARFQAGRDNSFVPATVFAADSDKDICILQADSLTGTPAQLGKAATLKVGEAVYAVGAPQGLELSLSNGLVSQLRGGTPPLIQTTAAISQGSSGGGLFDSEARLIGFTTYYYKDGQSLNFAMPVEWLAEIKPGKPITRNKRSQLDWLTRSAALQTAKDFPRMLTWTQLWVKTEPQDAISWYVLGVAYFHINRYNEASDAYRQALFINPEDAKVWNSLGGIYKIKEQFKEAIDSYRQALRINPEHAEAYYGLGDTFNRLTRYNEAINAYRQALRIKPEDAFFWSSLGGTYKELKRYDEAVDAYRQALRIAPEYDYAWDDLGNTYYHLKRYNEAIDAFRQALRINSDADFAWFSLGHTYANLKHYNEAIDAFRQALRINPDNASTWSMLTTVYILSGNTSAALQAVKSLRPLDPAQADRLFNIIVPR